MINQGATIFSFFSDQCADIFVGLNFLPVYLVAHCYLLLIVNVNLQNNMDFLSRQVSALFIWPQCPYLELAEGILPP